MLYRVLDGAKTLGKKILLACHEMPFTVVTDANLKESEASPNPQANDRSMNGSSLVGCHANRLGSVNEKSIYWLSRLLEFFEVKLVIGGHKHTYACTNPLREFYFYDEGAKNSLQDGPMEMEETLANDYKVSWMTSVGSDGNLTITEGSTNITLSKWAVDGSGTAININTTKFPLMASPDIRGVCKKANGIYYPCYGLESIATTSGFRGVTYFMCQATGYKLKSNKELPSPDQKFSLVIPKTNVADSGDKPNANQQRPMFAEIEFVGENGYNIYLARVENIMVGTTLFSQLSYSTSPAEYRYLKASEAQGAELPIFGNWTYTEKIALVTL